MLGSAWVRMAGCQGRGKEGWATRARRGFDWQVSRRAAMMEWTVATSRNVSGVRKWKVTKENLC